MSRSFRNLAFPFLSSEPTVKYAEIMKKRDMKKLWSMPAKSERRIGEIGSVAASLSKNSPAPPYATAQWWIMTRQIRLIFRLSMNTILFIYGEMGLRYKYISDGNDF